MPKSKEKGVRSRTPSQNSMETILSLTPPGTSSHRRARLSYSPVSPVSTPMSPKIRRVIRRGISGADHQGSGQQVEGDEKSSRAVPVPSNVIKPDVHVQPDGATGGPAQPDNVIKPTPVHLYETISRTNNNSVLCRPRPKSATACLSSETTTITKL